MPSNIFSCSFDPPRPPGTPPWRGFISDAYSYASSPTDVTEEINRPQAPEKLSKLNLERRRKRSSSISHENNIIVTTLLQNTNRNLCLSRIGQSNIRESLKRCIHCAWHDNQLETVESLTTSTTSGGGESVSSMIASLVRMVLPLGSG